MKEEALTEIQKAIKYLDSIDMKEKIPSDESRYRILPAENKFQILKTDSQGLDTFGSKREAEIARYCLIHFYAELQDYFHSSGDEKVKLNKLTADQTNLRITGFWHYGKEIAKRINYD